MLTYQGGVETNINEVNTTVYRAQKKEKVKNGDVLTYPMKTEESLESKRRSNWQCELDSNHTTFISNANRMPYMEAHHLIPMSAQD